MPEIKVHPNHQVTLPANIMQEANIVPDDKLEVVYTNGVIVLKPQSSPKSSAPKKFNIMDYAGICKGMWGETGEEVDQYFRDLRS